MENNPGGENVDEGRGEPSSTTGPDPLGEAKGKRANQGEKIFQPHLQVLLQVYIYFIRMKPTKPPWNIFWTTDQAKARGQTKVRRFSNVNCNCAKKTAKLKSPQTYFEHSGENQPLGMWAAFCALCVPSMLYVPPLQATGGWRRCHFFRDVDFSGFSLKILLRGLLIRSR